ncbi:MAG: DUF1549 domain-containing protein [Planctomycetales bacterium]|nr:DUF1549 domain-containing protein [Planctomycetales bacterium]
MLRRFRFWFTTWSIMSLQFALVASSSADESDTTLQMARRIDHLLEAGFEEKGVSQASLADDLEFLRRASLDLTGVVPRVSQVRAVMDSQQPLDRRQLIDQLLASPRHATHMANIYRDVLVPPVTDGTGIDNAAGLHQWLREQFVQNLRYDRLVSEFLSANGSEQDGPALFYRAQEAKPEKLASATAKAFLGLQIQCAECHDHPFDDWTQKDFWGYAAFFARLQTPSQMMTTSFRIVDVDQGEVTLPNSKDVVSPKFPRGRMPESDERGTRRRQLAIWMGSRDNPFLADAAVNRVWSILFGTGLVNPIDDMGPHNPATYPKVLDELSAYFVDTGFNMQNLMRTLALTKAYQRTSRTDNPNAPAFSSMAVKTLTRDQLYDSLARILSNDLDNPAARQAFMVRMQQQLANQTQYRAGLQQALLLMNDQTLSLFTQDSQQGILASLQAPFFDEAQQLETLFLCSLGRPPTCEESENFLLHLKNQETETADEALGDILWALLNSAEFQFNH